LDSPGYTLKDSFTYISVYGTPEIKLANLFIYGSIDAPIYNPILEYRY
jgi:hypothetical protein